MTTTAAPALKRIAAGFYRTSDGAYTVANTGPIDENRRGYWYWQADGDEAHDWYTTRREAVSAMRRHIAEEG
jgi:hypothetical protein